MEARVASGIAPTIDRLLYGERRVKFLCERCKTRYSIGDDRVRGKILKIRCKNCANVITVREGMNDEAASDAAARRQRPTTAAPASIAPSIAPAAGNGSVPDKAPAALEEEWYCSVDGQQSGPFSLAEAQRWVATKSYDAELHCWCEGFEDWLPVDKVSHFRNLRKPPRPNLSPGARPPVVTTRREEDPKPLFASTMAALERNADSGRARAVEPVPAASPSRSTGLAARQNGTPSQTAKGTSPNSQLGGAVVAPTSSATSPGMGVLKTSAASNAAADMFEAKTSIDDSDSARTAISPPLDDAMPGSRGYRSAVATSGVPEPRSVDEDDDEGGLAIGEVSRVVNLADLARTRSGKKSPAARPSGRFTPLPRSPTADVRDALAQVTGTHGPADSAAATAALGSVASPGDSVIAAQASVGLQRRGLVVLIGLAAVLLLGGIAAVVLFVVKGSDDGSGAGSLARAGEIDTSRPEEVIRRAAQEPIVPAAGSAKPTTVRKWTGTAVPHPAITTDVPETTDATKAKLRIDEIEDMARKQNDGTNRCYMRAQKGALGIEIQDLKKVAVTVTVAQDGSVSEVGLSDHADDQFGKCLIGRVKTWKFRASTGGTFRFELAFAQP
jgi:predicted Zn finger-like uncharacterized protein